MFGCPRNRGNINQTVHAVSADIAQIAPKKKPIEAKIAVWDGIAKPHFRVLALSAAP
jgi:hypothetical protein